MRALALPAALCFALAFAGSAYAQAEEELAERYAPVVRLVEQEEECGPGEPYEPIDVDAILDEDTVSLRGPWRSNDLVEIAPSADDLGRGLYEYNLDFPGDALSPGCDYERWARRVTADTEPAVYAHVAHEPAHPNRLSLQYWLYYPFNDWNNLHEGDWEMIQLVFPAATAEEALETEPFEIGYSQHEGAERAEWGEEKLELVDGTHPVVYPAAGSHANFFTEGLHLGRSAEQGVGCDDTTGPHEESRPQALSIPSDAQAAGAAFPWIAFEGRWASGSEPSTTARPARTSRRNGPSRSLGRRTGATGATRCRRAAPSGRTRPTSSAARSRQGRTSFSGPWTTAGGSRSSSASSPAC
jgi:hypothetical protein